MFVDRFVRWYKGEADQDDLFGNSVESAMSAVEKWKKAKERYYGHKRNA